MIFQILENSVTVEYEGSERGFFLMLVPDQIWTTENHTITTQDLLYSVSRFVRIHWPLPSWIRSGPYAGHVSTVNSTNVADPRFIPTVVNYLQYHILFAQFDAFKVMHVPSGLLQYSTSKDDMMYSKT
jgi:hypothetical protein